MLSECIAQQQCYVALKGGQTLAFAVFRLVLDETELLNIAVDPHFQRQGVAAFFLQAMLAGFSGVRRCLLEVAVGNQSAIALYRKLGFEQLALRKAYYQRDNGYEDAVIMCRKL